ncbi:nuclease-related domain-containing protein [Virgibacillus oceani]
MEKDLRIKRAEVKGEKEVDYPLGFLNKEKFLILHNLRLIDENVFFQTDTLLLHEKFFLILEVKNWYGTILFDRDGQVIRIGDDGTEEGFNNPIPQAKLQVYGLQKWLRLQGIENVNIYYFVATSFPNTILQSVSLNYPVPEKVIHNHQLFLKSIR